jgi:hypothetical protein
MENADRPLPAPCSTYDGGTLDNPNETPREPRSRRDALSDLQVRLEAALDELRPKIRSAFEELDSKVDAALADVKPRAQSAMREVRPKVDQFVADVQPRLVAMLQSLQTKIDDLRRDLDERAARRSDRTNAVMGEIGPGDESDGDDDTTVNPAGGI